MEWLHEMRADDVAAGASPGAVHTIRRASPSAPVQGNVDAELSAFRIQVTVAAGVTVTAPSATLTPEGIWSLTSVT